MEEIDIIELLQRVKEGKAPKEIEIENTTFYYNENTTDIERLYCDGSQKASGYWTRYRTPINTKIKILDKPIIKKFEVTDTVPLSHQFRDKINEIIDYINQNNKE